MAFGVPRLGEESRWISGIAVMAALSTLAALLAGVQTGVPVFSIYVPYGGTVLALALPATLTFAAPLAIAALVHRVKDPLQLCRRHLAVAVA